MILYNMTQSSRKSVAIKVENDGTISVKAPYNVPKNALDGIVNSKLEWIKEQQARLKQISLERNSYSLNYGDEILYVGKKVKIIARAVKQMELTPECLFLPEGLDNNDIRKSITELYKTAASEVYKQRAEFFASRINVKPLAVKVSSATTRWGSCSGRNSINLTWFLMFANESVIDYVIIHELAHIRHHDHAKEFWTVVEKFCPDYKKREADLKILQRKLLSERWL